MEITSNKGEEASKSTVIPKSSSTHFGLGHPLL